MSSTRMTSAQRLEHLASAEAAIDEEIAKKQDAKKKIQRERREEEARIRDARRLQVGTFAEDAGLSDLSDADLLGLFRLLTPLSKLPNPVAVLEGLLETPSQPRSSGHGSPRGPEGTV
jgi:hypothetical protein